MLVPSTRYSKRDLDHWRRLEKKDCELASASVAATIRRAELARAEVARFCSTRTGYISVSWGKDSVTMLSLAALACSWPIVWVRIPGRDNPDCELVRDAYFAARPDERARYHEIVSPPCGDDPIVSAHRAGFADASQRFGSAYITGLRGQESSIRKIRMRLGLSTAQACAPIGWWTDLHVFAWLASNDLPVHPAYACSMGGTLPRDQLRVAGIGGDRGVRFGRAEWERHYYPEIASPEAAT